MNNLIKLFTIILLAFTSSALANDKIFTMEEIFRQDGVAYNKIDKKPVNGIVKIYSESGALEKEISLKEGVRDGVSRSYNAEGELITEMFFKNERLISGSRPGGNGTRTKFDDLDIYSFNSTNPNSIEFKEAEAAKKINDAIKTIERPRYDSDLTSDERFEKALEVFVQAFERAGYNFFDTINKVANDLENHRENVPTQGESRHKLIIMLLGTQKSECEYQKIDCLPLYPTEVRESVKWLWENTKFSM